MASPRPAMIGGGLAASLLLSVSLIGNWEGKKNTPYIDMAGIPTVCYGETRVLMKKYTDQECRAMLMKAVEGFSEGVIKCTPNLANRPYQLAAATSLAYNIGIARYCKSTADKRFDQGNYASGCANLKRYIYVRGKVVKGLVNRREAEYKLCMRYV